MRILICGDREWKNRAAIYEVLSKCADDTVIIEGEQRGADKLSREVAEELGFPVLPFPADWNLYRKAAGPIRNARMIKEGHPDLVIAFHNDLSVSKGTKNMVNQAQKAGIPVVIISRKEGS